MLYLFAFRPNDMINVSNRETYWGKATDLWRQSNTDVFQGGEIQVHVSQIFQRLWPTFCFKTFESLYQSRPFKHCHSVVLYFPMLNFWFLVLDNIVPLECFSGLLGERRRGGGIFFIVISDTFVFHPIVFRFFSFLKLLSNFFFQPCSTHAL